MKNCRTFGTTHLLWVFVFAVVLLEGGCRRFVRTYPICLYDTAAGASAQAAADWPTLRLQLSKAGALVTQHPGDVIIVNSRTAVVKATKRGHKKLEGIWPPLACYGESSGSTSAEMLKICLQYVRTYLSYGEKLPDGTLIPPCQTLPGGGGRRLVDLLSVIESCAVASVELTPAEDGSRPRAISCRALGSAAPSAFVADSGLEVSLVWAC
jgi:hypothetical protein